MHFDSWLVSAFLYSEASQVDSITGAVKHCSDRKTGPTKSKLPYQILSKPECAKKKVTIVWEPIFRIEYQDHPAKVILLQNRRTEPRPLTIVAA